MAYLVSLLVVAAAVFMLATLAARILRPARRAAGSMRDIRAAVTEGIGVLAGRWAAVRVELDRRRSGRADSPSM